MKKIFPLAVLVCILLVYLLAHRERKGKDYNLDFEQTDPKTHLPLDWGFGPMNKYGLPTDKSYAAYHLDSVNTHHGKYAVCIDWTDPTRELTTAGYIIRQVYRGSKIRMTGFMKTENVTDGYAGLWLRLDSSGYSLEFNNMADRGVTGTTDWTEYTIELPYSPSLTNHILFGGLISGKGKIWLDDFHIYIDGVEIANAPKLLGESFDYEADKIVHDTMKADLDTTNRHGSGMAKIVADAGNIRDLKNLCVVWGILKYHHEDVARGEFNMDAELFRMLPALMHAPNHADAAMALEKWVDQFGVPSVCVECKNYDKRNKVYANPDGRIPLLVADMPETLRHKLTFIFENPKSEERGYYLATDSRFGQPSFTHEYNYPEQEYPDAGVRLLALFRYWNTIEYFYPYRKHLGAGWIHALELAIPMFLNAKNETEYRHALMWLAAQTHDSQGAIANDQDEVIPLPAGKYELPFRSCGQNGKWFVTEVTDTAKGIQAGDQVLLLNGQEPKQWFASWADYQPAPTFATERDRARVQSLRSATQIAHVSLLRDGKKHDVAITCKEPDLRGLPGQTKKNAGFEVLNNKVGYIRGTALSNNDLGKVVEVCGKMPDLLFDLRGETYASIAMEYSKWLSEPHNGYMQLNFDPAMPGYITADSVNMLGSSDEKHFKGRIWILVDGTTGPHAAMAALALATIPGSKTLGATPLCTLGSFSEIALPGKLKAFFTGTGFTYPDGTDPFLSGLKINIPLESGLVNNSNHTNEVLVKALGVIAGK